jgi:hypothetical protein
MCRAQARAVVSEMKKADQAASKGKWLASWKLDSFPETARAW